MPLSNDVVDCTPYFDDLWRCSALGNQIGSYYRTAELENCSYNLNNIYVCLRAKGQKDEAKALLAFLTREQNSRKH